ncbi:unnamed protein product [Ixodes pacificus]
MAEQANFSSGKSSESKPESNKSSAGDHVPDPKNIQDLTQYVQTLLQQMQDKFQVMSDQILSRNILCLCQEIFHIVRYSVCICTLLHLQVSLTAST